MNGHELAAQFIADVTWEDLPAPVQAKARLCLVDNLGATLAGTLARVSRISASYAAATWPGDAATILLYGHRAGVAGAAFANAAAANSIDIDDSARYAYGHAGAQVFPTALAVAEANGLSGAQMLCGLVVGYEIAHRVGRCWHDHHTVYQACGSWGSVASAAVAAHLMRLPAEAAGHALGIAEYHAPNLPMMRDIDNPAMVKHGINWGAMTGVMSAELAARGYTGIPSILSFPEYAASTEDVGQNYLMVEGVAWKPEGYACCGWAHGAVQGARQLVDEHSIAVEDIERICVETFDEAARLGTSLPSTTEEAQFNIAWPLAAMLVDGEVGPRQTLEVRLSDPILRDLAGRVELTQSDELTALKDLYQQGDSRGRFASRVAIHLRSGRVVSSGMVEGTLSFPQSGWDSDRVERKFRWLAGHVLEPARIDEVLKMLLCFDQVPDVRLLTSLVETPAEGITRHG